MKKIFLFCFLLFYFGSNLFASDIDFKIVLNLKSIGIQNVILGDIFESFDSVQSNNDIIELCGKVEQPKVVKISFSKGGFFLVFIDTSIVFISGQFPFRKFFDYELGSTEDSKRYQLFMRDYNRLSIERRMLQTQLSESASLDSLDNEISICILNNLKHSKSKYLNEYLLTSAKLVSKKDFFKTCFGVLKDKYKNVEELKSDYPHFKDFITEFYLSSLDKINMSFNFITLDSVSINLSDYKTKYIVIDFWANWCAPCLQSIPTLSTIANNKNNNTQVVSIALRSNIDKVKVIAKDKEMNWDIVVINDKDFEKIIYASFKINLLPTYFLCTPKGDVILRKYGADGLNEIKGYIERNQ